MPAKSDATIAKSETQTTRVSISFPTDTYATLANLAKQKRVSLAWVVRDAAEQYVCEQAVSPKNAKSPGKR